MPDTGTTNWPLDTDDLNLPSDMTIAPTSAGDGHYTYKQWLERATGMLRATAHDLLTAMTHNLPMGGFKITGLGTPTTSTDAATKAYVDATAQGLSVKASVKGASTTNHSVAAFSGSSIDGGSVSLSNGDRILLKDQSTPSQNGPWVFNGAGAALTRPTDFAAGSQQAGAFVFVESGTANANRGYVLSGTSITVDSTAETWVQFSGAGEITAGTGLTKTGDTINAVANADGTIIANADDLQVGTLVAGNVPSGLITSTMIADGTIANVDVNAGAAIAYSKLALTGGIVNADVNASAAIASSKLADGSLVTGAAQKSSNGSDFVSAATVRTNLVVPKARGRTVGKWYSAPSGVSATTVLTNNRLCLVAFDVETPHSIDRIGFNGSAGSTAARTVNDMVTNGTTTITSATAAFVATDVGKVITAGGDIPANTYLASVTNGTTAVMSNAATGSHSAQTLTLGASVVRMGIYNDSSGYPGSLLVDFGATVGTILSTGTGNLVQTVAQALTTGRWWLGLCAQGGTPTVFGAAGNNANDAWEPQQSQGQVFANSLVQTSVFAGLPDPAVPTGDNNVAPFVQMRIA